VHAKGWVAVIGLSVGLASARPSSGKEDPVASPCLRELRTAIASGNAQALNRFWEAIERDGAPLVEPLINQRDRLVTFLYRSAINAHVILMADFTDFVPRITFKRLEKTDVWYLSVRLPADAQFLYQLSVDDPAYPFVDVDPAGYPSKTQADALNPNRYEFSKPEILSIVRLPDAPSRELTTQDPAVPHGVVERFDEKLTSAILENERDVFVYKPPGYGDTSELYPLLLFGASYISQIRLPVLLDNLIARRLIPPVVTIFVGFPPSKPGQNVQDEEAGGGEAFGEFIAKELLPFVHQRVRVSTDPHLVVIGGASAWGHSAAFVGLRHPEAIGNVIAQSGAFWRGIGHTAKYWGDPALGDGRPGREGFARYAASRPGPPAPVRFYLTVGRLERGRAFDSDLVSMLHASRHVRDVLQAKGYDVTLVESSGGHDPFNWETTLPVALVALLAQPDKDRAPPAK
jgi:enterochelin esterase family protein